MIFTMMEVLEHRNEETSEAARKSCRACFERSPLNFTAVCIALAAFLSLQRIMYLRDGRTRRWTGRFCHIFIRENKSDIRYASL